MLNTPIRIHIFGASGSGTTTLGKALWKELDIPVYDYDDYYWETTDPPFTTKVERNERHMHLLNDIGDRDNYIISGHYGLEVKELDKNLTHAIFLSTPNELRMKRLKARERQNYGSRIDIGGDMYESNIAFLEWAKGYESNSKLSRNLEEHKERIKLLSCPVLQLDGSNELKDKVATAMDFFNNKCRGLYD